MYVAGTMIAYKYQDIIIKLTGATGVVAHNYVSGMTFYHSGVLANFTVNFTNIPTTTERATVISLIIAQGATAYIANAIQIDGVSYTIKWAGGAVPSGSSNGIDVITFSLLRVTSSWVAVLGVLSNYA